MKVGDLVRRKKTHGWKVKYGIITSLDVKAGPGGTLECASVIYPEIGQEYVIAVSLLEVLS